MRMSIHPSLRPHKAGAARRSVLSRHERIARLLRDGRFDMEKDSPFGLPKLRVYVAKRRRRGGTKKKETAE